MENNHQLPEIQLPESPASANVRVELPSGRQYQITLRAMEMKTIIERVEWLEGLFDKKGWKVPQWQQEPLKGKSQSYSKPEVKYVEGKSCPKCGSRVREAQKKDGTIYYKCETNKWNKFKNKAEGCDWVDWLK